MTETQTDDVDTRTLQVPGATLTYDVRGDLSDATADRPVLLLFGSPMGASGFTSLAVRFADRPVVTYDPRGAERSVKDDPASESTPEQHADDLHRLIQALGTGPVDAFGTSGGAVNGLALVAAHPEQVRTFVAHEPPLGALLPDRENVTSAIRDIGAAYVRDGMGAGMARFIALVSVEGPLPDDYLEQPHPQPADFGLPAEGDGSRDDVLLHQNLMTCTHYRPDVGALAGATTRIVPAAGVESGEQLAARGARALAERLGTATTPFPGGHGGFLDGEHGMAGDPDGFAAALRGVLDPPPPSTRA